MDHKARLKEFSKLKMAFNLFSEHLEKKFAEIQDQYITHASKSLSPKMLDHI